MKAFQVTCRTQLEVKSALLGDILITTDAGKDTETFWENQE